MIFRSDIKKRRKKVMSEKNQGLRHGRSEVEVGTFWLGNDRNNVIPDKWEKRGGSRHFLAR